LVGVAFFGFFGNCFSIYILSCEDMKNSFNHLLIVLACLDNLFLVFCLLDYSLARVFHWPFSNTGEMYALLFPKFLYPLNNITLSCSIFITVTIAFERYCAVCHPYTYRDLTQSRTVNRRVFYYVFPVISFSIILNLPKFFETRIVFNEVSDNQKYNFSSLFFSNVTTLEDIKMTLHPTQRITYEMTELRDNPDYIRFYINWCRLLLTCVLPLLSLIYFNYKIFYGIRYTHIRSGKSGQREANLAIVLVCIVAVFLICHVPRVILTVHEWVLTSDIIRCGRWMMRPTWNLCVTSANHLTLVINASVNFLIYCSIGTKFKDVLREVFSGKKSPHKAQYSSSSVAAKENMRVEQEEMMTLAPLPSTNTMATIAVISPASSPQKPNTTDL